MNIDCTTLFMPFLCRELQYSPTNVAQCIVCLRPSGAPVAGVVYDNYNGKSISAHIWIEKGGRPSKEWYAAIFDYPFNRLRVNKILGEVASDNKGAVALDTHFGFVLEAVIKDYSNCGDLLLYTMTKEQCRVLNSPAWSKVVDFVGRAA